MPWASRYRDRNTPWDVRGPHPELLARIEAGRMPAQGRALVPGCGYGHDALALARAGMEVTALDMVELLQADLEPALQALGGRFLCCDALAFEETGFDLLFDHTFFCAIDPQLRPQFGQMVDRVLGPQGQLQSLVFPVGKPRAAGGPPHSMCSEDLATALGPGFRLLSEGPVETGVTRRDWQERWAIFVRR